MHRKFVLSFTESIQIGAAMEQRASLGAKLSRPACACVGEESPDSGPKVEPRLGSVCGHWGSSVSTHEGLTLFSAETVKKPAQARPSVTWVTRVCPHTWSLYLGRFVAEQHDGRHFEVFSTQPALVAFVRFIESLQLTNQPDQRGSNTHAVSGAVQVGQVQGPTSREKFTQICHNNTIAQRIPSESQCACKLRAAVALADKTRKCKILGAQIDKTKILEFTAFAAWISSSVTSLRLGGCTIKPDCFKVPKNCILTL